MPMAASHTKLFGSLFAFGALALAAGCGGTSSEITYSTAEPRVATYSAGAWTVERRPDDAFSTYHSIFGTGADGWPVALRSRGGETTFGHWNGSDWDIEQVVSDPAVEVAAIDDGDQLVSGLLRVAADGSPHALFVTSAKQMYYAGKRPDGQGGAHWVILPFDNIVQTCYDIAVAPDGSPRMLLSQVSDDTTRVAQLDSSDQLVTETVLDTAVCGSIAVADDGKVGTVLWVPNDSSVNFSAKLYEKAVDATEWSGSDVVTNGNPQCGYCYVPELGYRGDGVPIVEYVDSTPAVYLAERLEDGTFSRHALAVAGQSFQLTRLKRAPDGSMGAAVILDLVNIGVVISRVPDGETTTSYSYTRIDWTGTQANTPRLAFTQGSDGKSHAFISFWDTDGLYAVPPGGYPMQVDPDANEGYRIGGVVSVGPDGIPQVFYNETHALD